MELEDIQTYQDFKKLDSAEYETLCAQLRERIIDTVANNGGHLASNLGTVELTVALLASFDLPQDKLIWDVGHQTYTHKILTGRNDDFDTLRQEGGLCGFSRTSESIFDAFDTGHSSTSISAGLGYVYARELSGLKNYVVSVIGDGSMTGGLYFEALNNAAKLETNFIIVVNDNNMSISENVGGISRYLEGLRTADSYLDLKSGVKSSLGNLPGGERIVKRIRRTKSTIKSMFVPGMAFEDMGITYLGPVDGHNIEAMKKAFQAAKRVKKTVVVHVITEKGRGYEPARRHPDMFHGIAPFDRETGRPRKEKQKAEYADVLSKTLCAIAKTNSKVCAITAAMESGVGLKRFHHEYPERFFDVGIAEAHAVTFAAGLAKGGMIPVVAVYSSFLQRAYDQILHDVAMPRSHVVFAIDRAGIVGADGETHQGLFDLSYLLSIPHMTVMAPKNTWELADMLRFAVSYSEGPVAIRYPRGEAQDALKSFRAPVEYARSEILYRGSKVALLSLGSMLADAYEVAERLQEHGVDPTIINARFAKPVDRELLLSLAEDHSLLAVMEENVEIGGFGALVRQTLADCPKLAVRTFALPDEFVAQGDREHVLERFGLDADDIAYEILESLR